MGLSKEQAKASAQHLFCEAESMKAHLLDPAATASFKETQQIRRKLCQLLERLLLTDLDYALDKKVEQDLWSIVFRSPITELQSKTKDQKNSSQAHQGQLALTLEAASGFYLQLLQKLSHIHNIDSFYYPKGSTFSQASELRSKEKTSNKSSVVYICQHCMVHLGDIARYRGQSLQAETFYRHAIELIPSNGQPYNQLAILEAASGEKLSTVFFYIRSLAVQHPFPLAATNLQKLYLKLISDNTSALDSKSRMSAYEYISAFLQFHALVHVGNDFPKAEKVLSQLTTSLPALIIAEKLETWQLLQMATVCMFTIGHAWSSLEGEEDKIDYTKKDVIKSRMSADELETVTLSLDLIASMLNAFLLPIHAVLGLKESKDYFTLPAVKIVLDWLFRHHKMYGILTEDSFIKKPQVWHGLCKLLNNLSSEESLDEEVKGLECVPLPEDWDLQCFLPLQSSQVNLQFQNQNQKTLSDAEACQLRAFRLIKISTELSEIEIYGNRLFSITEIENGAKSYTATQSIVASDQMLLQQIQELAISASPNSGSTTNPNVEQPEPILDLLANTNGKIQLPETTPVFQEVRFKLDDHKDGLFFTEPEPNEVVRSDTRNYIKRSPPPNMESMSQVNREQRKGGRQNVALQAILQQRANQSSYSRPKEMNVNTMPTESEKMNWMPNYNSMPNLPPQMIEMKARYTTQNPTANANQYPLGNVDLSYSQHAQITPSQQHQTPMRPSHQTQPNKPTVGQYASVPQNRMLWNYNVNFPVPNQSQTSQNPTVHSLMMQQQLFQAQQQQAANNSQSLMQSSYHQREHPSGKMHEPMLHEILGGGMSDNLQSQFNNPMMHRRDQLDSSPSAYGLQMGNRAGIHNIEDSQMGHFGTLNQTFGSTVNRANQGIGGSNHGQVTGGDLGANTYSLFSSPWSSGLTSRNKDAMQNVGSGGMDPHLLQHRTQSLWSGPVPSPLERLLEEQKKRRDASSHGN